MIHAVLVFNNSGKTRLARFYTAMPLPRRQGLIDRVYGVLRGRADDHCCCVVPEDLHELCDGRKSAPNNLRIVYRSSWHFATLYFAFIVDHTESDLATLDLIQVFVQALDNAFDSVCELDLVYHFDKANYVLDEVVMGGLVLESNIDTIKMALREAA
ncbi:AP-3 complex subunit sigma-2, putative [Perkinsus marinus ATCC 50983]|uniref:AP complex subunit sigma n=1 Tax=Perkinsus marinus (strain ATCC 50983 / TXsc) TaxID=423536 RepID=C5L2S1_PERM5|nr:AP-3 complex subunit sigma-2, putative [Perkinsus marinus ATCC 50983]EER08986.1 AP-3 complex subunit sigma-2, putative [Perkinsus marinus ATCC 50983]|eukprot:XP_002777170.1 AP-3 complex subunit sigma-2, putative [Perkinsus marinus ATCC 50983]